MWNVDDKPTIMPISHPVQSMSSHPVSYRGTVDRNPFQCRDRRISIRAILFGDLLYWDLGYWSRWSSALPDLNIDLTRYGMYVKESIWLFADTKYAYLSAGGNFGTEWINQMPDPWALSKRSTPELWKHKSVRVGWFHYTCTHCCIYVW